MTDLKLFIELSHGGVQLLYLHALTLALGDLLVDFVLALQHGLIVGHLLEVSLHKKPDERS